MENQEANWSDYWRNDGKDGEVFVDKNGRKPAYIKEYWANEITDLAPDSRILDVACGAGSIYEDLKEVDRAKLTLHATDISAAALQILETRVENVNTVVCTATDMPFEDNYFDMVVSQFGIEYAGLEAYKEAARILAPGGKISFLSHYAGGYIDSRNEAFLNGATMALTSGFIPAARALIEASFSGSKTRIRHAKEDFVIAEKPLAQILNTHPEGIHNHLYFGFRQMYLKFKSYNQEDIVAWLGAMEKDIKKNIKKVSEIRTVSLDQDKADSISKSLIAVGFSDLEIGEFVIRGESDQKDRIIAWKIRGRKSD